MTPTATLCTVRQVALPAVALLGAGSRLGLAGELLFKREGAGCPSRPSCS